MKQKLTKEQIDKRKKIKDKLMKVVHLICYICTFMLILIGISVGVQSCKGNKQQTPSLQTTKHHQLSSITDTYSYAYDSVYSGVQSFSSSWAWDFNNRYEIPNTNEVERPRSDIYRDLNIDAYAYHDGGFVYVNKMQLLFSDYDIGENESHQTLYRYRLKNVLFYYSDHLLYMNKVSDDGNNYQYNFAREFRLLMSSDLIVDTTFNEWFNLISLDGYSTFNFVNNINYYFWAGKQTQSNTNTIDNYLDIIYDSAFIDQNEYHYVINLPYFVVEGHLYNRIILNYRSTADQIFGAPYWIMSDGSQGRITATNGYGYFYEMIYSNSYDNDDYLVVYSRDEIVRETDNQGGLRYYYTNSCSWLSQSYRRITFVQEYNQNSSYNVELTSLNTYSTLTTYQGNVSDVFTLLGYAFTSITSILEISLIPGITFGMLLCMPLAVATIIIIVKLVKK